MKICPFCEHENIEGADHCEQCEQPLSDMHLPTPATEVERRLLSDRIPILKPKSPAVAVPPDTPVRQAIDLLVEKRIGCVVVVEDERVVGIFSERDALMKLNADAAQLGDEPVSRFMTSEPQTLDLDAKVAFAVQRMDLGSYRHVPIVDAENRVTGIISVRDILTYLTAQMTA